MTRKQDFIDEIYPWVLEESERFLYSLDIDNINNSFRYIENIICPFNRYRTKNNSSIIPLEKLYLDIENHSEEKSLEERVEKSLKEVEITVPSPGIYRPHGTRVVGYRNVTEIHHIFGNTKSFAIAEYLKEKRMKKPDERYIINAISKIKDWEEIIHSKSDNLNLGKKEDRNYYHIDHDFTELVTKEFINSIKESLRTGYIGISEKEFLRELKDEYKSKSSRKRSGSFTEKIEREVKISLFRDIVRVRYKSNIIEIQEDIKEISSLIRKHDHGDSLDYLFTDKL